MRTVLSDLGGAHLLRTLPDGLATRVGPGGAVLSTSERQLITLARALLRAPTFLVLDEPTSSLDESQDEALQRALHALRGHCTTIVIAHRTTTARACDTAALVRDGQVVAHGNPEDVLVHLDNIRGGRVAG
ncbi:ATP-binding cassette domain-containing protein [Actinokineospora soli]|uniref:ATP-binding cassette domain-containing protein n=1 Tax=Actinokineospora soli TaxID=1048753 RepID=A0ABW2TQW9_9PSEU